MPSTTLPSCHGLCGRTCGKRWNKIQMKVFKYNYKCQRNKTNRPQTPAKWNLKFKALLVTSFEPCNRLHWSVYYAFLMWSCTYIHKQSKPPRHGANPTYDHCIYN
jgi:hypothetical protein